MDDTTILSSTPEGGGSDTTNLLLNTIIRLCWKCGTFATSVVVLLMGVLYLKQDSLLYFPTINGLPRHNSRNPKRYRSPSEHGIPFETHEIPCEDGTIIHSWLLYHPESDTSNTSNNSKRNEGIPTILFFHGNAGNIGLRLPNAIQMYRHLRVNVWLIEYRGFGDSEDGPGNAPDEKGLKGDAEGVWRYIHGVGVKDKIAHENNLKYVDPRRIFVFGRSLGGAAAFHLAHYAENLKITQPSIPPLPPLAGLIVENTFLSISQMVDHLMPYVSPLKSLILRIGWDSASIAPSLRTPTLFLAGAKDTLVPHRHMLELHRLRIGGMGKDPLKSSGLKNLVRLHVVKDGTHNETWMQGGREYWLAIFNFLEEVRLELAADDSVKIDVKNGSTADSNDCVVIDGTAAASSTISSGPILRKATSGVTSFTRSISSTSNDQGSKDSNLNSLEVSMGFDGEESSNAGMIPSVENFIGMAREATRNVGNVGASAKLPKPYKKID